MRNICQMIDVSVAGGQKADSIALYTPRDTEYRYDSPPKNPTSALSFIRSKPSHSYPRHTNIKSLLNPQLAQHITIQSYTKRARKCLLQYHAFCYIIRSTINPTSMNGPNN
eukprot:200797_1